jgi:Flp pilus assembly CpaF family ATPase
MGIMNLPKEQYERLLEKLSREIRGPIQKALADKDVIEIVCNSDGSVWQLGNEKGWQQIDQITQGKADSILSTVAALTDNIINYSNPQIQCAFPLDGSRLQGLAPPAVKSPIFDIRKHSERIYSLEEYVSSKIISDSQAQTITKAVIERKNILISGGTCSGKTTLAKTIIDLAYKLGKTGERFVIIEDTKELHCNAKNAVSIHAFTRDMLSRFTQAAMRLRPDRVILGEVRGREAYDLMYLLNSGHPGFIHYNPCERCTHGTSQVSHAHPANQVKTFTHKELSNAST